MTFGGRCTVPLAMAMVVAVNTCAAGEKFSPGRTLVVGTKVTPPVSMKTDGNACSLAS